MYGAGLRVTEAAQIGLADLRPEQDAILIHGKGGPYGKNAKHRLVPLNPSSRKALDIYLIERDNMVKRYKLETGALFFAVRNRYAEEERGPLNVRSVRRMLVEITKLRGLPPMHPHLLRHACATHMLDHGCPLDVIAEILGHDNIDVTAHYAQVSTRLMMETYNAAHPHASPAARLSDLPRPGRPASTSKSVSPPSSPPPTKPTQDVERKKTAALYESCRAKLGNHG
jgi:integrase/recombinase XerC